MSRGSSLLTVYHRGEGIGGEVMLYVQLWSRMQRESGDSIKPHSLPPVTDFLQQASTSPSFHNVKSSAPAGDQVSNTWAYRGHPTFRSLKGAETYMTHILGSLLYPTSFSSPFSLSPSCFFWFSVWFQSSPKEVKAATNLNKSTDAAKHTWSPGALIQGRERTPHALSPSRWPVTQMLGCVMDRTLHTCRRQGSEKRRHSINITK